MNILSPRHGRVIVRQRRNQRSKRDADFRSSEADRAKRSERYAVRTELKHYVGAHFDEFVDIPRGTR